LSRFAASAYAVFETYDFKNIDIANATTETLTNGRSSRAAALAIIAVNAAAADDWAADSLITLK